MINFFKKSSKSLTIGLLSFFFVIIGFSIYQVSQAQEAIALSTPPASLCNIASDLKFGMVGPDVKELQKYLNNNGYPLAQAGFGSKGQETNNFVTLTKNALIKFQKDNKIPAMIGVFDKVTRDFLGCEKEKEIVPEVNSEPSEEQKEAGVNTIINKYSLSGTITGISGPVILKNNNDSIIIKPGDSANFTFPTKLITGSNYFITATTDYPNQKCYLKNNSGTIYNADVDNIQVACVLGLSYSPFTARFGGGGGGGVSNYSLTYTAGTGGTISGTASQSVNSGGNGSAVTAVPDTGYSFSSWSDSSTDNPRTDTNVRSNLSVTASFTINTYTVTFDTNGGDGGSTATQTLNYNTPTALTANGFTRTGYTFAGWNTESDGSGTDYTDEASYTIGTSNVTLYAKWEAEPEPVTFVYNGAPVTYGVIKNPTTGEFWLDRNLGASRVALSSTDSSAYGDLFQWGRADDGHQIRTSDATTTLATSDTPEHNNFIINSNTPFDWRNPQNGNLWQGVSGTNNPCPSGYRLPTDAEWEAERESWVSNDADGAFASPLKLLVAGFRRGDTGSFLGVDSTGYYWSSTLEGIRSRDLFFHSSSAGSDYFNRWSGLSVRCIKD